VKASGTFAGMAADARGSDAYFMYVGNLFRRQRRTANVAADRSRKRFRDDFQSCAAQNDIKPIIEEFTHKTANGAIGKIRDGTIRLI
jgi:hypothetical protein